jgi:cation diffusion facilitator family transporter
MAHGANTVRTILYALGANFSIAVAKFVAAFVTGSGAMMAEAIHSVADTGNQVLLLLGLKQAKRPPTDDYPLGHGKAIYLWSFLVALLLFSMGGMYSLYEGWHKLHDPEPLKAPWVAIGVLVFAIAAEGASMWGCLTEVNKVRGTRTLWKWFRESRQSELIVVFGEDLAALAGLVLALLAVVATLITGNPLYDALGTLAIGILLVLIAIAIAVEVKALLIGQGVEPNTRQKMLTFLTERDQVSEVYGMRSLQMGDDVMVAVKARMRPTGSEIGLIQAINETEVAFKEAFPEVVWLFFEPDITDD